jgi:hypothetical protein
MDELQEFGADEAEDLAVAAGKMAGYWKARGLGDAVRAIGREEGVMGARVLLAAFLRLRAERHAAEHAEARDAIPW